MNSIGVQTTLAVLLLCVTSVEAGEGAVKFWKKDVTMTCPQNGTWFSGNKNDKLWIGVEYKFEYSGKTKGSYHCTYQDETEGTKIYKFYVKGKVCENCFELNADLVAVIISLDLVGTVCIMSIIYHCTKKRSLAASKQPSTATSRSRGGHEPPRQHEQHYEPLSARTRSEDAYSTVNRVG